MGARKAVKNLLVDLYIYLYHNELLNLKHATPLIGKQLSRGLILLKDFFMTVDPMLIRLFGLPRLLEVRWLSKPRTSLVTDDPAFIAEALAANAVDAYLTVNRLREDVAARRGMPLNITYLPSVGQCVADSDIDAHYSTAV